MMWPMFRTAAQTDLAINPDHVVWLEAMDGETLVSFTGLERVVIEAPINEVRRKLSEASRRGARES